jgi:vacuolar-type H+-ATPase subunit H
MPEVDAASGVDARSVDAAITRVLQAERAAREEVQRCAEQAEAIVERAHERARQVARRAAHRSVRVQRWSAAVLQDRLDRLAEQQAGIEQAEAHAAVPGHLPRAVETLAAQLTGASR